MSWGALSAAAIRALNEGARRGELLSRHRRGLDFAVPPENGGDLVWEIGSGYFGCRNEQGRVRSRQVRESARSANKCSMIEIKLSQGAKPGHGGVLPGAKVTQEIARHARRARRAWTAFRRRSIPRFRRPWACCEFVAKLRELSGGKPTGFKLAIGHPWEWFGIAKAMQETGLLPDFIVVDGAEGGTGAAPAEFIDHVGVPMHEALMLVHNTLVGLDLRDKIRIGAAGRIVSAFDMAQDDGDGRGLVQRRRAVSCSRWAASSRCRCHTDKCPTGVATQDPRRWQATRRGRQGHARAQLPPEHAARAARPAVRGGPGPSGPVGSRTHPAPRVADRSAFARGDLSTS